MKESPLIREDGKLICSHHPSNYPRNVKPMHFSWGRLEACNATPCSLGLLLPKKVRIQLTFSPYIIHSFTPYYSYIF